MFLFSIAYKKMHLYTGNHFIPIGMEGDCRIQSSGNHFIPIGRRLENTELSQFVIYLYNKTRHLYI